MEQLVKRFWECSLKQCFVDYPFEQFFDKFGTMLYEKLAKHGILTFEDYLTGLTSYYDFDPLGQYVYESVHKDIKFTFQDIISQVFRPRYEKFRKLYIKDTKFLNLAMIYVEIQHSRVLSEVGMVVLIDKCLHAEHNGGNVIGIDMAALRDEFQEEVRIKELLLLDRAFGIYTRNALELKIAEIVKNGTLEKLGVIFIDFIGIKGLNTQHGYEQVNKHFVDMFTSFDFRESDLVARYFSGDEIVIITDGNAVKLAERFLKHAHTHGLDFRYEVRDWDVKKQSLSSVLRTIPALGGRVSELWL